MRVQGVQSRFKIPEWNHAMSVLLDAEPFNFLVLYTYPGPNSIQIDFQIYDPTQGSVQVAPESEIRHLSGNERMLYLYQLWVTNDPLLKKFPYEIVSLRLFAPTDKGGAKELFVSPKPIEIYVNRRPGTSFSDGVEIKDFFIGDKTFTVNLNDSQSINRLISWWLLVLCLLIVCTLQLL